MIVPASSADARFDGFRELHTPTQRGNRAGPSNASDENLSVYGEGD